MNPEYIEQLIRKYGSVTSEPLLDLITNVVEDAVLEEREACAQIVEREAMTYADPVWAIDIVNDIRARGQK